MLYMSICVTQGLFLYSDMNASMNIPAKFDMLKEEDFEELTNRIIKEANPLYPVPKEMDREECMQMLAALKA